MKDIHGHDLVEGQRYQIVHQSEMQRKQRMSVMIYLGPGGEVDHDCEIFSARPIAGTQSMPRSWIKEIKPVPATVSIQINRDWRGDPK